MSSADQVYVEVKYALSGARAHVHDRAVAVLDAVFVSQFRSDNVAVTDQF